MKKITKYIAIGLATVTMTACADLDTEYLGKYVSTDQKASVVEQAPEMGSASVTGIYSQMFVCLGHWTGHCDFGYPATMIGMDIQTEDYACKSSGYNWFNSFMTFAGGSDATYPSAMMWFYMYDQIYICNAVASSMKEVDTDAGRFYYAQALATRSWNYWNLIQCYAFNYAGNENGKGVPVITEENAGQIAADGGCARGTVQQVYDQIMKDIDKAIECLTDNSTTRSSVLTSQSKRMVDLAVCYGLRARYNLTMHKYAEAANDATMALQFTQSTPYQISELGKPGFTTMDDNAWMWGIAIQETQEGILGGSIVNFPSMVCSFCHGYTDQGGAWKWCGKKLYDQIPKTDIRKMWFLDEKRQNANLNKEQADWIASFCSATPSYGADATANMMPYTNVKYNSYQGVIRQGLNASDIPLMRVEEMYLTQAEAKAMSGDFATGKQLLENFVKTYRNPSFASKATNAEELQNECWIQRRIELWGEGLAWFDVMRLHKGIDRRNDAFPSSAVFAFEYGSPCMILVIPNDEISANRLISTSDNNEPYSQPVPVSEED